MSATAPASPAAAAPPRPPGAVGGVAAWRGREMDARDEWTLRLEPADIAELETALADVQRRGLELARIGRDEFPLPTLAGRLDALRAELLHGRGFALLRGLPVARYTLRESATLYWGIGAHLGSAVPQNAQGHLLGHVIDVGRDENDPSARIYQTRARQFYHADSCDIVGLLCLRKAREGGESTIVSSVTVHDEMLARAPDLLAELFAPFHVDRRGEIPVGAKPWYEVPVFNWHAGALTTYYVRRYITSARRFPEVPPLTTRQEAAFDLLDAICDDPDIHLAMAFEPGDMQFLHNHQVLHDRRAYVDWEEPDRRRHLLRLWLCPADGRPLPPAYRQRWGSIEIGRRGGIRVPGVTPVAPLEP